MSSDIVFNFEWEDKHKCHECRYWVWYHKLGRKYGCHASEYGEICGSFKPIDETCNLSYSDRIECFEHE